MCDGGGHFKGRAGVREKAWHKQRAQKNGGAECWKEKGGKLVLRPSCATDKWCGFPLPKMRARHPTRHPTSLKAGAGLQDTCRWFTESCDWQAASVFMVPVFL